MRTIPLVLITFVVLSLSPTAASFEQCRATVSGIYGFCTPNPYPGTGYGKGGTWNV